MCKTNRSFQINYLQTHLKIRIIRPSVPLNGKLHSRCTIRGAFAKSTRGALSGAGETRGRCKFGSVKLFGKVWLCFGQSGRDRARMRKLWARGGVAARALRHWVATAARQARPRDSAPRRACAWPVPRSLPPAPATCSRCTSSVARKQYTQTTHAPAPASYQHHILAPISSTVR